MHSELLTITKDTVLAVTAEYPSVLSYYETIRSKVLATFPTHIKLDSNWLISLSAHEQIQFNTSELVILIYI